MEHSQKYILANMKQPQKIMISLIVSFVLASIVIYIISNPNLSFLQSQTNNLLQILILIGSILLFISWIVIPFKINTIATTLEKIESHLSFQNNEIRKSIYTKSSVR